MAITKGWDAVGYAASGSSVATAVSGQPAAGSTIAVWVVNEFDGSETFSGLTDNAGGNTYTNVATASLTQSAKRIALYRAVNINTTSGFEITGTWSATTFTPSLSAVELIGVDNAAPIGVSTVQQQATPGTGTDAVTSGSAGTPSEDGHFVFGCMRRYSGGGTGSMAAGTGYTALHRFPLSADFDGRTEYLIQSSASAVAATFTQGDAGGTICGVASFKPAASGTALYFLDSTASGSNFGQIQVGGSAPSTATTATGWTVDTVGATNYSLMAYASERLSSTFSGTAQPAGNPDNSLGDCFRTTSTLSGDFATGVWTIAVPVIAVSAAAGQDGRVRVRLWKSANATGTSPTEITSGAVAGTTVTNLTTGAEQVSTVTTGSITGFSLANEYLFVQIAWEITGAAT